MSFLELLAVFLVFLAIGYALLGLLFALALRRDRRQQRPITGEEWRNALRRIQR